MMSETGESKCPGYTRNEWLATCFQAKAALRAEHTAWQARAATSRVVVAVSWPDLGWWVDAGKNKMEKMGGLLLKEFCQESFT